MIVSSQIGGKRLTGVLGDYVAYCAPASTVEPTRAAITLAGAPGHASTPSSCQRTLGGRGLVEC